MLYTAVSKQSDCSMKSRMTTKQLYTNANTMIAGLLELLMCHATTVNEVFILVNVYRHKELIHIIVGYKCTVVIGGCYKMKTIVHMNSEPTNININKIYSTSSLDCSQKFLVF